MWSRPFCLAIPGPAWRSNSFRRNRLNDILGHMRLLHVVHTLNPDRGGPSESVRMFAQAHQRAGNEVEIVSLDSPTDGPKHDAYRSLLSCDVHPCGPGKSNYGYTPRLTEWIRANRNRFDGVIVNGIWQYHGVAARSAVAGHKPYVVFAHGMLDPYFKDRYPLKHFKKLVYWLIEEHRTLNSAQAVCFTSQEELRVAADGFPFRNFRRVIIPYGTTGPSGDPAELRQAFFDQWPVLRDKEYLLYLGRIHPKKGCDLLMEAFGQAAKENLWLVMAGPDDVNWTPELQQQAARLGAADRIIWTGMLRGPAKWGAFYGAQAFILPSHQENFGIAVADALACGTIPLISDKVNIAPDIAADGAGFMDTDTAEGTARLISAFQNQTLEERTRMRLLTLECYRRRYALNNAVDVLYHALGLA